MIRLYATLFFMLLSICSFSQSEGIRFEHKPWQELLEQAKSESKLLFIDAYAEWCGPCKWMAVNIFPDSAVGAFMNTHFINAKIDMEKGEGPDLQKKYEVRAYPTYLFVNGEGELIHRFCGSMSKEKFLAQAANALNPDSTFLFRSQKFAQLSEKTPEQVLSYVKMLDGSCISPDLVVSEVYVELKGKAEEVDAWADLINEYPPAYGTDFFTAMVEYLSSLSEESANKVKNGVGIAVSKYMFAKLRQGKEAYLEARQSVLEANLPESAKNLALSDLYFYRGQKDWDKFVESVETLLENGRGEDVNFLNSMAWTLYESVDADQKKLLEKGLSWSKKALDLKKDYAVMDTYAALLYKLGKTKEAGKVAREAIELAKSSGDDYSGTEKLIEEYEK